MILQVKCERDVLYKSFTVDDLRLRTLTLRKRELSCKLQIISRLRRLFKNYLKGLSCKSLPPLPFVPLDYRSNIVPLEFYESGIVGRINYKNKLNKRYNIFNDYNYGAGANINGAKILNLIAKVKGKLIYKDRLM